MPVNSRNSFVHHTVESGESVRYLALTSGIYRTQPIYDVNPDKDLRYLKSGDTIILPVTEENLIARVLAGRIAPKAYIDRTIQFYGSNSGYTKPVMLTHRVRRGDTLSHISQKYRVPLSKLRAWNNLSRRSMIYPGDEVIIFRNKIPPRKTATTM